MRGGMSGLQLMRCGHRRRRFAERFRRARADDRSPAVLLRSGRSWWPGEGAPPPGGGRLRHGMAHASRGAGACEECSSDQGAISRGVEGCVLEGRCVMRVQGLARIT
jgi:hypothetical protein